MIVLAVSASKTRAVLSRLPVSTHRPSGLNDALYTEWRWPRSSAIDRPVPASQMRAVWSKLAVTTRPLSRLEGHNDEVWSAVFSPDSGRVVTASFDQTAGGQL